MRGAPRAPQIASDSAYSHPVSAAKPHREMTAAEVKAALRSRHPATQINGLITTPGPWTTIEEYRGIDLLAFSAHSTPGRGAQRGVSYPRVGYEVKVSRADLRQELLHPEKRSLALDFCHEFYFAVPRGLLSKEELAWQEPAHFADYETFQRATCPGPCHLSWRGKRPRSSYYNRETGEYETCPTCGGRGYLDKSRAEAEAPTCWLPRPWLPRFQAKPNPARQRSRRAERRRTGRSGPLGQRSPRPAPQRTGRPRPRASTGVALAGPRATTTQIGQPYV